MAYVREYRTGDAEELGPILREADKNEIQAASGLSPVAALTQGLWGSHICCSIIGDNGDICGMYGVVPSSPSSGYIWLLASDELTKGRILKQFIKRCEAFLDILHDKWPLLHNYVDKRNTVHIRWLKRMGFTFIKEHPEYGHEKRPFLEFVRLR